MPSGGVFGVVVKEKMKIRFNKKDCVIIVLDQLKSIGIIAFCLAFLYIIMYITFSL